MRFENSAAKTAVAHYLIFRYIVIRCTSAVKYLHRGECWIVSQLDPFVRIIGVSIQFLTPVDFFWWSRVGKGAVNVDSLGSANSLRDGIAELFPSRDMRTKPW